MKNIFKKSDYKAPQMELIDATEYDKLNGGN